LFDLYYDFIQRFAEHLAKADGGDSLDSEGIELLSNQHRIPGEKLLPVAGMQSGPLYQFKHLAKKIRVSGVDFADDSCKISGTAIGALRILKYTGLAMVFCNMAFNIDKTKFFATNPSDPNVKLHYDGKEIERVSCFKYLGRIFTETFDFGMKDFRRRISLANGVMVKRFGKIFSHNAIDILVKLRFFKEVVIPTIFYGVECWFPNTAGLQYLESQQKKLLLRVLGRHSGDRISSWELYKWFQDREIAIYPVSVLISSRRLSYWARIRKCTTENLAANITWSDVNGEHKKYMRESDRQILLEEKGYRADMEAFGFTEENCMTDCFRDAEDWEEVLATGTATALQNKINEFKETHQKNVLARGGIDHEEHVPYLNSRTKKIFKPRSLPIGGWNLDIKKQKSSGNE
jgi:hypothetical protein